jgi:uncharacterized protein involved in exopolysaccharide biosynthesis
MNSEPSEGPRTGAGNKRSLFPVAVAVGLLVFITAVLITFILPESFVGVARLKMPPGTPPQLSSNQLAAVVESLNLNTEWGRRYLGGDPLPTPESVKVLQARTVVAAVGKTTLIEVRVYSERPSEAAELANALARETVRGGGEIIDLAVPTLKPIRPNKPLNLALGALGGVLAGALAAAVLHFATTRFGVRYSSH